MTHEYDYEASLKSLIFALHC